MKCITTHKKNWEIGGALGKNDIIPICPYSSTHSPQNLGTPSVRNLCFWNEQDLGNLQLKRYLQVYNELKIL